MPQSANLVTTRLAAISHRFPPPVSDAPLVEYVLSYPVDASLEDPVVSSVSESSVEAAVVSSIVGPQAAVDSNNHSDIIERTRINRVDTTSSRRSQ
ncbi:MAG: hypothetical protein R3A51_20265 [Nannocystaceae bacterium]|nr:hypothetical protein [Myxococcales bacterium]